MLVKGSTIVQVKKLPGFDYVGTEFEVTNISKDSAITFYNSQIGSGLMSFDEFETYFEEVKVKANVWTDWQDDLLGFKHRNNGKRTEVRVNGYRSTSCCCDQDTFNAKKGIDICLARIELKMLDDKVREAYIHLQNLIK